MRFVLLKLISILFLLTLQAIDVSAQESSSVLLIHGLNNPARIMVPLSDLLKTNGFKTSLVTLTGHEETNEKEITNNCWQEDVKKAVIESKAKSVSIVAYSMGALAAVRALDLNPDLQVSHLVLFAPPLALRTWTKLLYTAWLADALSINVPALTPRAYRLRSSLPASWYEELLSMYQQAQTISSFEKLNKLKVIIYIAPDDEFTNLSDLKAWREINRLENWEIRVVHPSSQNDTLPSHFIVDRASLGEAEWSRVSSEIVEFLKN